jgi:hypothetical protein
MVRVEEAERMNLLGLLLQGFLTQQLASPKLAKKARKLRGDFGVHVADMAVTLSFAPDAVTVRRGIAGRVRAGVRGSMKEMIPLVTGGGGLVPAMIAVLEGRIEISGNPFALLRLMPLLLAPARRPAAPVAPPPPPQPAPQVKP